MRNETRSLARALTIRFADRYPGELARALEALSPEECNAFLQELEPERLRSVLESLSPEAAASALEAMDDALAARALLALDPPRAAAFLARLDTPRREQRLALLPFSRRTELEELAAYPPGSAAHRMDSRVMALRPDTSVARALETLRAARRGRIQDVFLIDDDGKLRGAVAVQDLATAPPDARLATLARGTPLSVQATAPSDDVLEALERGRGASVAVVDYAGHLLGVLRQEELLDTARQDATADVVTMVGASEEERALSSPWFAVRKRLPWLEVNLATAFLAAMVVGLFEETIARNTALAVLLPVVAGQSGNTGAQALAVTMRGLYLREVRVRQWLRLSLKEVAVGALNGVAVALTTALAVYVWSRSLGLALVIGLSMVLSMTAAGLAGAGIPLALTAARQDPAQSSSIFLTTVTDVVGFFSFLGIATVLSSLL